MNFGFLKIFTKNSNQSESIDSQTSGNGLLNLLSSLYESQNTPVYLINSTYELVWANKKFRENFSFSKDSKCYNIFLKSSTICQNCPSIVAFQKNQPLDKFVATHEDNGTKVSLQVFAVPVEIDRQIFSLNFVLEKEIPSTKGLETSDNAVFKESPELNKLLFLFENLSIPISLTDLNFNVLYLNKTFKEFLNPSDKVLNRSLFDICNFKGKLPNEVISARLANSEKVVFTSEISSHSAKRIPITIEFVPIQSQDSTEYIVSLFYLTTEDDVRTTFEQEHYEIFTKLIENGDSGIFVQNDLGQIVYQNDKAGKIFKEFPEFLNEVLKHKEQIFRQGQAQITVANSNTENTFLVEGYSIKTRSTRAHYHAYVIDDLTQFKNTEQELNSLKQTLAKVERKTKSVLFKIDSNFKITDVTGSFYEITGYKVEEFVGKGNGWVEIVYPDDYFRVQNNFSEMFHFPNLSKTFEYRIKKANGEIVWVETLVENVVDSRGKILYLDCITFDIDEQKQAEERLKASQEEMRNLAMYFESLREEEKKKLAFEIHDELGHILTAMKLELSWVLKKKFLREEVLHEKLHKMIEMIDSMIRKVRSISSQLRPSVLDHFGITAAIEWQAKEFQKQTAIRCRLNLPKQEIQLSEAKSIVVFRVFQEILTNIARHANATRVDIHLDIEGNNLVLTVADNGKGIKPEDISAKKSLGIFGMKERARSVNGKLTISGVSNIGTTVTLTIPIN